MESKQQDIRELSKRYAKLQTLMNHVNYETLIEQHRKQMKNKAVGVDNITKEDYEKDLDNNLKSLLARMKSFSYRPQDVRRTCIPKGNGKLRPLGIPAYEDKLVQGVMAKYLMMYMSQDFSIVHTAFEKIEVHMIVLEKLIN